ncbi:hypothetical protein PV11_01268 [Exophiala sideris]|uniref:CRIB domain-containing protein n=1 Tax=Exophiala sideris TaxID=1016849 RepID=A0A0D1W9T2_9EURO|nr:hypothetical protein PV11_01268 [Exophiala sideris]
MGRFQWIQGHPKQGSDRLHAVAHDWFSKDGAEPSRQALVETMKDHASATNDMSPSRHGRSRTNTTTSSVSSFTRSLSNGSNEVTSRPSSGQSSADINSPLPDRHEGHAKSLISRGTRILKRQGSKLSLMPSQMEEPSSGRVTEKPGGGSPIRAMHRPVNVSSKRTGLKQSISGPFAFQHLSHGDQAQFPREKATKSEPTSEHNSVQAVQQPVHHVCGISIEDLPSATDPSNQTIPDEPTSPLTNTTQYLPITPPRPDPPPKDNLLSPYSPLEFRLSRSMENFSRPKRLSFTSSEVSPASRSSERLSALSPINRNSVRRKPLPIVKDVVHAVSTRDDIALPLRTAPLPSPPSRVMEVVDEEGNPESCGISPLKILSARPSCNDVNTVSSQVQRKRRSQSSGELHTDAYTQLMSTMTIVEASLDEPIANRTQFASSPRISVEVKSPQMQDWEGAIDDAWDNAADSEYSDRTNGSNATLEKGKTPCMFPENNLFVEQVVADEGSSSASTPLMMQLPRLAYQPGREEQTRAPMLTLDPEPSSPLLGLGIASLQPIPDVSIAEPDRSGVDEHGHQLASSDSFRSHMRRSPASCISKSSSQESIILSIASSIIGTQRSSNSSTTFSDFARFASFGDSVDNLKLDLQDPTTPVESHGREKGSQETIREECQSTFGSEIGALQSPNASSMSSPGLRHDRGASAPQIWVPERKSSLPGDTLKTQSGRRRAGTTSSRPRKTTRVSYSLFPTPATN